jgi:hypothetical protein
MHLLTSVGFGLIGYVPKTLYKEQDYPNVSNLSTDQPHQILCSNVFSGGRHVKGSARMFVVVELSQYDHMVVDVEVGLASSFTAAPAMYIGVPQLFFLVELVAVHQ